MSQNTVGQTFTYTTGALSPVTAQPPSGSDEGQRLLGITYIETVVSAPAGNTLLGGGSVKGYFEDDSVKDPVGRGTVSSGSLTGSLWNITFTQGNQESYPLLPGQYLTSSFGLALIGSSSYSTNDSGSLAATSISGSSTVFVNGTKVVGLPQTRWVLEPSVEQSMSGSTGLRDFGLNPLRVTTPRQTARFMYIPVGVTFTPGTGSIQVTQMGFKPGVDEILP